MMHKKLSNLGFSLIELLVVISIIGVLAAVLLPNLVSVRERAADSRTKSQLNSLKSALRLYYNDFQQYPAASDGLILGCGSEGLTACGSSFAAKGTTYMDALPSAVYTYVQVDDDNFLIYTTLNNLSDDEVDTGSALGGSGNRCGVTSSPVAGRYYVCD